MPPQKRTSTVNLIDDAENDTPRKKKKTGASATLSAIQETIPVAGGGKRDTEGDEYWAVSFAARSGGRTAGRVEEASLENGTEQWQRRKE
jgi:hypothetical protein